MKCPVDGETLLLSDRSGIEIDYCPSCRGVWLDRGELDKIIDRSLTPNPSDAGSPPAGSPGYPDPNRSGHHGNSGHGNSGHNGYGNKRRGGWLGDLFGD
ncbi:zf-TFIIB domain-containing protein [Leifsonia sp. TF02-11]|uniref:TFIIB-type zinc ribbon-containing protein n=1 Tax=Leifsonia sp. TF02-11 TaxID=2815212 RepID=UPI001AA19D8D|nr:zf-TFIIB domain-containing protein [Leifsonia sp. TF02-11]MBO1741623.1 zf-TFIIB domain-containing protein [Leifsonia sp. TF02-11]